LIHKGEFGQIFASPLEERYLGKGLAGGTSLAAALGLPAGSPLRVNLLSIIASVRKNSWK